MHTTFHLPKQAWVKEHFDYNPETCKLTRKKLISVKDRNKLGSEVGNLDPSGYLRTKVLGHRVTVHAIIWCWMTGEWPTSIIDHKDRDRANNRWDNLREASQRENHYNTVQASQSKTGYRGVRHRTDTPRSRPYQAVIRTPTGRKVLGDFATPEEASAVYEAYAKKLQGSFYLPPQTSHAD